MLFGCAGKRRVTLYVPSGDALTAVSAVAAPTPEGLIAALYGAGALPSADVSYLYCACASEPDASDETQSVLTVRLDVSDAFGAALAALPDERAAVQALADTFLDFYGAARFVLTVEGINLQTLRENYTDGITFDEYIPCAG